MEFFTSLEQVINHKLLAIMNTYLTLFADKMVILLMAAAPILVLYYGYSVLSWCSSSTATMSDMLWNMARIGIVLEFMRNTGNLLDLSIGFIHELKSGFVGAKSIFALLDQHLSITKQLAEDLYNLDVDYIKFRGFFASAMLWFGSVFVVIAAAIVFISAEVGLTLLTATAPIFIGCLTYGFLKEMFNGWLRSIFSCVITLIFASMIVRMGLDLNSEFVRHVSQVPEKSILMEVGALNFAIGVIISFLILKSAGLAGNIAGVAATSAIQGGMTAAAAATSRFSGAVAGRTAGHAAQGVKNFGQNTKAAWENRNKLREANQQAAIDRVKQANINSGDAA